MSAGTGKSSEPISKIVDHVQRQGVPQIETRVSERTRQYVSISICGATKPLSVRCIFEIGYRKVLQRFEKNDKIKESFIADKTAD